METTTPRQTADRSSSEGRLDPVVTLSQLADQLGVSVQTLYDLRSQGRGPRGFRVGREVRFRVGEVDSWLAQMEADDAERHPRQAAPAAPALRSAPTGRSTPAGKAVEWSPKRVSRMRQVRASAPTAAAARSRLLERLRERPSLPSAGVLQPTSSFADLADLWLADLDLRDLAGNTKENYRTCLRLHVRPAFEHYTLAEVSTGRVEWFLAKQAKVSPSQAKQTRTLLNMLFGYALRHDALARNPVEGTSRLRRAKATPQALTIDQIAAIREAAVTWRSEPGLPGPKLISTSAPGRLSGWLSR